MSLRKIKQGETAVQYKSYLARVYRDAEKKCDSAAEMANLVADIELMYETELGESAKIFR